MKRPWCWERLRAGGEGDDRGWDGWMVSLTQWTWVWVDSGVGYGQGGLMCCGSWGHKESDTTERLNWTEYLHCLSEWVCFPERMATTDLLNEGNAQFDSLPDKLQGMPAVSHCFRWLLTPWHWLWTPILKWRKVHRFSTSIFCFSYLWLWSRLDSSLENFIPSRAAVLCV